jgi:hypothetical protein
MADLVGRQNRVGRNEKGRAVKVPVKSSLVNWLPWSVLKISGRP